MTTIPWLKTLAAALGAALVLAACGGGAGSDGASAPPTGTSPPDPTPTPPASTPAYSLTVDAHPLTATTTVDTARATTMRVDTDGATLAATGADGTVYRLSIPNDALTEPVTITMTPLLTISGLPFGESMHGVKLEPDGQQFRAPVRLDIVAPSGQSWPLAQQIAIGLQGAAQNVTLSPVDHAAQAPGLLLMHFSSYALVLSQRGLDASLSGLRQRLGGDAEQRIQSAMGEELQRERQISQLGRPPTPIFDGVVELLRQYQAEVLAPRLAAATGSCAANRLAQNTLFMLQRNRQLMGLAPTDPSLPAPDIGALLSAGTVVCIKEEFELCRDQHIVTRIRPKALSLIRSLLLVGMDGQEPPEIEAYVGKCLRFELQVSATTDVSIDNVDPWYGGLRASETVEARVPIVWQGVLVQGGLEGEGVLVSRSFDVTVLDPCDRLLSAQRVGGSMRAMLDWEVQDGTTVDQARVKDFRLGLVGVYASAGSTATLSSLGHDSDGRCASGAPSTSTTNPGFATVGNSLLVMQPGGNVLVPGDLSTGLTGWAAGAAGSARLASKDIDFTVRDNAPPSAGRLRMSLVLMHTPAAQ